MACSKNSKEANVTSTVSSKDSEADEVFKVTGKTYRPWRTVGHGRDSGFP